MLRPQLSANWWTARARIINLAVFRAAPRRDSRSLLIVCVIGRKRTARVIGDHHGREVGTATVLLAATDPCWSGWYLVGTATRVPSVRNSRPWRFGGR